MKRRLLSTERGRAEVRVDGRFIEEARICSVLPGCTSIADLTPQRIATETPATEPGVLSVFPLLREPAN